MIIKQMGTIRINEGGTLTFDGWDIDTEGQDPYSKEFQIMWLDKYIECQAAISSMDAIAGTVRLTLKELGTEQ